MRDKSSKIAEDCYVMLSVSGTASGAFLGYCDYEDDEDDSDSDILIEFLVDLFPRHSCEWCLQDF